jgi:hypothetical protein
MAEPFFLPVVPAHEPVRSLVHHVDPFLIEEPQI